jgi:TolB-like protein
MRYEFEDCSLDPERRELRRGADLVPVEPKVFDLLLYLIRHRDRVVSKDDLIEGVWNGRIVSESALTSRITAARQAIGDSGDAQRLIRTVPRKGLRFVGEVREDQGVSGGDRPTKPAMEVRSTETKDAQSIAAVSSPVLPLPDKPSIAVLPFMNLSGDVEQDYFTDGIVEDIITALSRMQWLFVIARNSSFTYKGRAVDVKHVGRELGVRYVLEGSVRKSGSRMRITGQLIDALGGGHLWADRFDGAVDDIFDLQDQVTASVVGAISPKLEKAEIARAKRKPTESLDAYDYFLRGSASIYRWTKESHNEALRLFYKAIELDPDFASAYGVAARCYAWRATNGWMVDKSHEIAETSRLCQRAVDLGKDDAVALYTAGHALARVIGDLDAGAGLIDRALALNPNLAAAWSYGGWVRVWLGEPDEAISRFAHAMRLSPLDPQIIIMQAGTSSAHFIAGRYDEASTWAEKAIREAPDFAPAIRIAVASNALAGRPEQATKAMARMREVDPGLRISNIKDRVPYRRPQDQASLVEGLRRAGVPE